MSATPPRRGFATRPGDPENWIKAAEPPPARAADADLARVRSNEAVANAELQQRRAEISELHVAVVADEDVGRADVAMDDPSREPGLARG